MRIIVISSLLLIFSIIKLNGQRTEQPEVIQFSGVVVTQDEYGEMIPLPYTTISIQDSDRGTYSEIDGFFSIVASVGDTIVFSRVGFESIKHEIPDTLESKFYSWYQIMSQDDVLLPQAVIYPWPSKEHYKIEFLAMDVSNELRERAQQNLAQEVLERAQHAVGPDGAEAFALEQQRAFTEAKYSGQFKPMNIGNLFAWSQFIQAWRRGDFKKKKKKKNNK